MRERGVSWRTPDLKRSTSLPILSPRPEEFCGAAWPRSGSEGPLERRDRTLCPPDGLRIVSESHHGARVTCQLGYESYFDTLSLQGGYEAVSRRVGRHAREAQALECRCPEPTPKNPVEKRAASAGAR